jgi:HEXXH motif-containing protein
MSEARSHWSYLSQTEGAAVDQAVRSALVTSLKAVYTQVADEIDYDDIRLQGLLRQIESGPVRPAVFGLYTDLVVSKLSNDTVMLDALSQELLDVDPASQSTRILSLTDEDLGTGHAARYARLIDDDPERRCSIRPLDSGFQDAYSRVCSALLLLDQSVPELAQEIRSLVREIVLVTDAEGNEPRSFDGASTFYLWGAVLLNVGDSTRLDLAQQIAHEAAHLLLFGLMMGQPLTENDLEERHTSPLRQDPRPMEGVVHAAYVLARMSYALERLLDSGLLSLDEQEKARLDLATHRGLFFDTLPVIMRHARLKPGGDSAFRGAIEYMSRENELRQVSARCQS